MSTESETGQTESGTKTSRLLKRLKPIKDSYIFVDEVSRWNDSKINVLRKDYTSHMFNSTYYSDSFISEVGSLSHEWLHMPARIRTLFPHDIIKSGRPIKSEIKRSFEYWKGVIEGYSKTLDVDTFSQFVVATLSVPQAIRQAVGSEAQAASLRERLKTLLLGKDIPVKQKRINDLKELGFDITYGQSAFGFQRVWIAPQTLTTHRALVVCKLCQENKAIPIPVPVRVGERTNHLLRVHNVKRSNHPHSFYFGKGAWTDNIPGHYEDRLTLPRDAVIVDSLKLSDIATVYKVVGNYTEVMEQFGFFDRRFGALVVGLVGKDHSGQLWGHRLPPNAVLWDIDQCENWLFQLEDIHVKVKQT